MSIHGRIIDALAAAAIEKFRAALTAAEPVLPAIDGLDLLLKAGAMMSSLAPLTDDAGAKHLLGPLVTVLVDAVSPAVASEQIAFGLGCANAILISAPDQYHVDRLLYSSALLASLRIHVCKTELSRRGDPLMRLVAIRRAAAVVEADPTQPVH